MTDDTEALRAQGKVVVLETRGRMTGRTRRTPVGFIDDGGHPPTIRVAASDDTTDWARNLLAQPHCRVLTADGEHDYLAAPLADDERSATISALILRYGTPSERLGGGPAFRLVPTVARPEPADPERVAYTPPIASSGS